MYNILFSLDYIFRELKREKIVKPHEELKQTECKK